MSDTVDIQQAVAAAMAGVQAQLVALKDQMGLVGHDAREARDATIALKAQMGAENLGERITALKGDINAVETAYRSDLQTAIGAVRREHADTKTVHETRLAALEAWRNKADGATGLLGWLSRWAPWLINGALGSSLLYLLGNHK